jgi:serralysin
MANFSLSGGLGFNMPVGGGGSFTFAGDDPFISYQVISDNPNITGSTQPGSSRRWGQTIWDVHGGEAGTLTADYWAGNLSVGPLVQKVTFGGIGLTATGLSIQVPSAEYSQVKWLVHLNDGDDTFAGNDFRDVIHTGSGNDIAYGYGGDDILSGDLGDDTLYGGVGNDTLIGGDGTDTVAYSGLVTDYVFFRSSDGSILAKDSSGATDTLRGIELLQFSSGTQAIDTLVFQELPSLPEPLPQPPVLPTEPPVVQPLPPTPQPQPSDPFMGDAGSNVLYGDATSNTLQGFGGNDRIYGGAGNDRLYGGNGNDVLSGGSGEDSFIFDTKPNKSTNRDTITDFRVVDDTIRLDNAVFTKVGANGTLKSSGFYANLTGKAHDRDDRIIYEKDTGRLFYDADGTGSKAAIHFATVGKKLTLTNKEFYII